MAIRKDIIELLILAAAKVKANEGRVAPKPILTFWGSVTRALDREKPKERHFPAGCRVEAWDFGERQVLVLSGRGQVSTYSGEAPSA
jgi:hypothetical protein